MREFQVFDGHFFPSLIQARALVFQQFFTELLAATATSRLLNGPRVILIAGTIDNLP